MLVLHFLSSSCTFGWTSDYTSGYTSGWNSGCTSDYTSGWTSGYTSGWTSGYTSGWTSGYTSGYTSSWTSSYTSSRTSSSGCASHEKCTIELIDRMISGTGVPGLSSFGTPSQLSVDCKSVHFRQLMFRPVFNFWYHHIRLWLLGPFSV